MVRGADAGGSSVSAANAASDESRSIDVTTRIEAKLRGKRMIDFLSAAAGPPSVILTHVGWSLWRRPAQRGCARPEVPGRSILSLHKKSARCCMRSVVRLTLLGLALSLT